MKEFAKQKSSHRLASKESGIFAHNLKLSSMTSRLKIEAQRAAACNTGQGMTRWPKR